MKKLILFSAIIGSLAISANGQVKFDGSYSAANYKQPNKAKLAKELNLDKSLVNPYSTDKGQATFDNYKNTFAKADDNGGIMPILPAESGTGLASQGNYKLQNKRLKTNAGAQPAISEPVVVND